MTGIASFALVIIGVISGRVGGWLGGVFGDVSVFTRYDSLGRGVVDLRDILYFVCFTGFFLYLNAVTVENGRYR